MLALAAFLADFLMDFLVVDRWVAGAALGLRRSAATAGVIIDATNAVATNMATMTFTHAGYYVA